MTSGRRSAGSTPKVSAAIAYRTATSTSAPPRLVADDPLRDLLNSALSSPSGRCVITDESGALIGTASDHDVMDAIRRAKEARTAA